MHCSRRLILQTLVFSHSYLHSQVSPPETLVVKGGTTWTRNGQWILPENDRLPRNIQGSFRCRKSTTWDKRPYFPSEGRRAEDFFALKNPTASAGFEPANLFTKGQHATSRPPKLYSNFIVTYVVNERANIPFFFSLYLFFVLNFISHSLSSNPVSFPKKTPKHKCEFITFRKPNSTGNGHKIPGSLFSPNPPPPQKKFSLNYFFARDAEHK